MSRASFIDFQASSVELGCVKYTLRASRYLLQYPFLSASIMILALAATGLQVWVPRCVQTILELIKDGAAIEKIWIGSAIILAFYLGSELCNGLRILASSILDQRILIAIRAALHARLLQLSPAFYVSRQTGEISSRLMEDVAHLERALIGVTQIGLSALATILGVSIMLFYTNAFLACFVFAPLPFLIVIAILYSRRSRVVWRKVRDASGALNSLLLEDIQGHSLVRSFTLQERETERFKERLNTLADRFLAAMRRWAVYQPSTAMVAHFALGAIIAVGGSLILKGTSGFSFPEMFAFVIWAGMLYVPIGQLHEINHLIAQGEASGARVYEVLEAKIDVENPTTPRKLPAGPIRAEFKEVHFEYGNRKELLQNFNLVFEPQKVTALVGHTGSGKSTIANLVLRSYDVQGGSVKLNGVDVRELSLKTLHRAIGYVPQEPFLFEGSVYDNLALAAPDADEATLKAALKAACADDFVWRLPKKLHTTIGERGVKLSQGEKQRLTLARVFLKNPPMLILDEATSSLDSITERKIQQALQTLLKNRTVLIIAHRLSTIRKADKIIVLEQGRILEQGSHKDLLLAQGRYAELWLHQVDLAQEGDL